MKKIKTRASKPKTAASPIPKSAIEKMEDLKARLQEAEETIEAIRSGAVDALVVSTPEGEQIFTLRGAEYPYRVFFETMNEGGAVISPEGLILACNKSFEHMVGVDSARLCGSAFYDFIPSKERTKISRFVKGINETETKQELKVETELLASGGEKLPVKLALSAVNERKKAFICAVITDLSDQKRAEEILWRAHDELEFKVGERTLELEESKTELEFQNEELHSMREKLENYAAELERSNVELESLNKELEAFIDSVSHDLRAPLRTISCFIKLLVEDYAERLDAQGRDYLTRVCSGSKKMEKLIEDLLNLSRLSRQELDRLDLNISKKASSIVEGLRVTNPDRQVKVSIKEGLAAFADPGLTEVALFNLLENAWKFTSKTDNALIEFDAFKQDGKTVYYVRDNGAGFDPQYKEKLFQPFRRLHSEQEFEGTGIGLSIVLRIIRRHGGRIWAEGETGKGATFFFTLN